MIISSINILVPDQANCLKLSKVISNHCFSSLTLGMSKSQPFSELILWIYSYMSSRCCRADAFNRSFSCLLDDSNFALNVAIIARARGLFSLPERRLFGL